MRLNGWQRLWLVTVVLWTAAVVLFAVLEWPTTWSISQADVVRRLPPTDARKFRDSEDRNWPSGPPGVGEAGGLVGYSGHSVRLIAGLADADRDRLARTYVAALTVALDERRSGFILEALAWWAIPVFMLYAFGWAIAWVRRGFVS
jgi:hypothetical protein